MINYNLTRSKRKTIAIYIRNNAVDVCAPHKTPKSEIERFVVSKEKWILKHLEKSSVQAEKRGSFTLGYGSHVIYRGKRYTITASGSNRFGISDDCFYVPANLAHEQIKSACVQMYKILAKSDITQKVYEFAGRMSVMPASVKINGAKTRWGSCSAKKNLNFSWRLIMADDDVVDYVVVHELSHIKEMNHSARFWAVVEEVLPDYRERKSKLKELQHKLNSEDWD